MTAPYDDDADVLHALPASNGHGLLPVHRLSAMDLPFRSTGIAQVKVTIAGREGTLALPIVSVGIEEVEHVVAHMRPRVPTSRDKIKGQWVTILNEADESYQQRLQDYQKQLMYAWVLMAMDVDIYDEHDEIVWSRDNTTCQLPRAIAALKRMGLVDNQALAIFRAVQALTQDVQELLDRD